MPNSKVFQPLGDDKVKTGTLMKTLAIPTHLDRKYIEVGWGNGYIGVPEGHPWFGKDYDAIDCDIHGGLTYADNHAPLEKPDGFWWVGFDTAHLGDNSQNRSQQFVIEEIERLKQKAIDAADAMIAERSKKQ